MSGTSKTTRTAIRLRYDAKDYDVRFPLEYADQLEKLANDVLKSKWQSEMAFPAIFSVLGDTILISELKSWEIAGK